MPVKQKIYFIIEKKKKGYNYTVVAENGQCLDERDPQSRKHSVQRAIASFCQKISNGEFEIIDTTKPASIDLNKLNKLLAYRNKK